MLLQPETRPTSQEQLVNEVKGIYAGLAVCFTGAGTLRNLIWPCVPSGTRRHAVGSEWMLFEVKAPHILDSWLQSFLLVAEQAGVERSSGKSGLSPPVAATSNASEEAWHLR
jgi:hypothetical protein